MRCSCIEMQVEHKDIDEYSKSGVYKPIYEPFPNQGVILKDLSGRSMLGVFDPISCLVRKLSWKKLFGMSPANKDLELFYDHLQNPNINVIVVDGVAGSGKTSTATAAGIKAIDTGKIKSIAITRPNSEVGKGHGFLPGDLDDKIDPHMAAFYYWINKYKSNNKHGMPFNTIDSMKMSGELNVFVLAYARGLNLEDSFFMIDEAQNMTKHEIKTLMTRVSDSCKIVVLGDSSPNQIDTKSVTPEDNGLVHLKANFQGEDWFAWVELRQVLRGKVCKAAVERL